MSSGFWSSVSFPDCLEVYFKSNEAAKQPEYLNKECTQSLKLTFVQVRLHHNRVFKLFSSNLQRLVSTKNCSSIDQQLPEIIAEKEKYELLRDIWNENNQCDFIPALNAKGEDSSHAAVCSCVSTIIITA